MQVGSASCSFLGPEPITSYHVSYERSTILLKATPQFFNVSTTSYFFCQLYKQRLWCPFLPKEIWFCIIHLVYQKSRHGYIYIYMLESWNCPRNWLAVTMKDIHVLWSFRRMKAKVPFMLNMWVQIFASIWRPSIANKSGIGQILAFLFNNLGYRISLDSCG